MRKLAFIDLPEISENFKCRERHIFSYSDVILAGINTKRSYPLEADYIGKGLIKLFIRDTEQGNKIILEFWKSAAIPSIQVYKYNNQEIEISINSGKYFNFIYNQMISEPKEILVPSLQLEKE